MEKWKSTFRNTKCAGTILFYLSKAFDCIHHLMLANPQKFQALFLNCKEENYFTFDLDNVSIIPDDVVKLLAVHLDSKLNF